MMFADETIIKQLSAVADSLELSDSRIVFRGKTYACTPENQAAQLTNLLYARCYALKQELHQEDAWQTQQTSDASFVNRLSANNESRERVEKGWTFGQMLTAGLAEVSRGTYVKQVPVHFMAPASPAAGQQVQVYFPKEEKSEAPGFYYVFSDRTIGANENLVRVYWNIEAEGAAPLIRWITQQLNRYRIPFIFKCLNHPVLYTRRDAAVLYLEEHTCDFVKQLLPACFETIDSYLHKDVPLFAYAYRDGIGLAESPGMYESFGMHRMKLVAEAAIGSQKMDRTAAGFIRHVASVFINHGFDPAKPYLNKGSKTLPLC